RRFFCGLRRSGCARSDRKLALRRRARQRGTMLSANCSTRWRAYGAAEKVRVRAELTAALREFVDEFQREPVAARERWAWDLAQRVVDEGADLPVRMPLFREVLFPALLAGLRHWRGDCARWLAGFDQLLYHSPECRVQLPEGSRSAPGLLRRALAVDPGDVRSKRRLLAILRSRFDYVLHELPDGVLYGADGATPAQCEEMLEELREFAALVRECGGEAEDPALIEDARFHLVAYRDYVQTRQEGETYADYLAQRGPAGPGGAH
ncbi:MAG: hypothetical protein NTV51_01605, partial [Verrucomicrobia bacterium]|nr:hypothetical protein [Verrucomicrobiota bacterium]